MGAESVMEVSGENRGWEWPPVVTSRNMFSESAISRGSLEHASGTWIEFEVQLLFGVLIVHCREARSADLVRLLVRNRALAEEPAGRVHLYIDEASVRHTIIIDDPACSVAIGGVPTVAALIVNSRYHPPDDALLAFLQNL